MNLFKLQIKNRVIFTFDTKKIKMVFFLNNLTKNHKSPYLSQVRSAEKQPFSICKQLGSVNKIKTCIHL